MTTPHILLATPCYGGVVNAGYLHSVLELSSVLTKHGIGLTVEMLENESVFTRARSYYVARMLGNNQFTHLLNVDADIIFDPESVLRLLSADKDVIAGCYPRKSLNWDRIRQLASNSELSTKEIEEISYEYIVNVITPDYSPDVCQVVNGLLQVGHAGGGFLMVKRQVLEKLAVAHPELKFVGGIRGYNPPEFDDNIYSLWEYMIDPESKRYLSDDWAFCKRWRNQGGEVWVDLECKLTHVGTHQFKGSYARHLVHKFQNPNECTAKTQEEHPDGCPTWRFSNLGLISRN